MRVLITMLFGATIVLVSASPGQAELLLGDIYVIDEGVATYGPVVAAEGFLTGLGYALTTGDVLSDYSAYSQVWDLRYNVSLHTADQQAMGDYLGDGGRLYLTGEHSNFDVARNNSLISLIVAVGGGALTKAANGNLGYHPFTAEGQLLNTPNVSSYGVAFNGSRTVETPDQGILVTVEDPYASPVEGSLVAWDFGDITGAPHARMVVCFDLDVFTDQSEWTDPDWELAAAALWTENVATFLGVPEPSSAMMWSVLALFALGAIRGRRRAG